MNGSWKKGCLLAAALLMTMTGPGASAAQQLEPQPLSQSQVLKAKHARKVVIIIDDFGNDQKGTEEMMDLPIPFTAAIMPFLPTTKRDAKWAHELGRDVIVHLPMEPNSGKKSWLGPGAITTDLSDDEIRKRVHAAVDDVPYAVGMNNHMGSKATADERVMTIVLEVCKERGLFFVDSRTTGKSVAAKLAAEIGVSLIENNIFLDDEYTMRHVEKQINKVKKRVRDEGVTVVIGHVGPPGKYTAEALKKAVTEIEEQGAEFASISEVLAAPPY